jgi:hypothetical protein
MLKLYFLHKMSQLRHVSIYLDHLQGATVLEDDHDGSKHVGVKANCVKCGGYLVINLYKHTVVHLLVLIKYYL